MQVAGGDAAQGTGFADIVDIDAAALDVLARLALGGAEAAQDEKFHQRRSRAAESAGFNFPARNFAGDFVERFFGNAFQAAAKKNFARAHGLGGGGGAVDEIGHGLGQGLVGGAGFGPGGV